MASWYGHTNDAHARKYRARDTCEQCNSLLLQAHFRILIKNRRHVAKRQTKGDMTSSRTPSFEAIFRAPDIATIPSYSSAAADPFCFGASRPPVTLHRAESKSRTTSQQQCNAVSPFSTPSRPFRHQASIMLSPRMVQWLTLSPFPACMLGRLPSSRAVCYCSQQLDPESFIGEF